MIYYLIHHVATWLNSVQNVTATYFVCAYVCVFVSMYVFVCVCLCVSVFMSVCVCVHVCVFVCIFLSIHMYVVQINAYTLGIAVTSISDTWVDYRIHFLSHLRNLMLLCIYKLKPTLKICPRVF